MGFSMKEAWDNTDTADEPINHIMVEMGLAKNPKGMATINKPVYNWEVLNLPKGNTKSFPPNLLIPNKPPATKIMTNNNNKFVTKAYTLNSETMAA